MLWFFICLKTFPVLGYVYQSFFRSKISSLISPPHQLGRLSHALSLLPNQTWASLLFFILCYCLLLMEVIPLAMRVLAFSYHWRGLLQNGNCIFHLVQMVALLFLIPLFKRRSFLQMYPLDKPIILSLSLENPFHPTQHLSQHQELQRTGQQWDQKQLEPQVQLQNRQTYCNEGTKFPTLTVFQLSHGESISPFRNQAKLSLTS